MSNAVVPSSLSIPGGIPSHIDYAPTLQVVHAPARRLHGHPNRHIHRVLLGCPFLARFFASTVAHIDALQIEYSPWSTDHEQNGLIDAARELGVAIIAYSPLGKGMLTGKYQGTADFADDDIRKTIPRFNDENMKSNIRIVDEFKKLADKKGCEASQLALAWVIAQGAIPIPGTKSAKRLEENFGATEIELSKEELQEIRNLIEEAKPRGARYGEAHLKMIGN